MSAALPGGWGAGDERANTAVSRRPAAQAPSFVERAKGPALDRSRKGEQVRWDDHTAYMRVVAQEELVAPAAGRRDPSELPCKIADTCKIADNSAPRGQRRSPRSGSVSRVMSAVVVQVLILWAVLAAALGTLWLLKRFGVGLAQLPYAGVRGSSAQPLAS